jgi:two-component system chemotaxis sensor kinase CheA
MPRHEDELLQRLRATFQVEAQEHVQTIASGLITLERAAPAADAPTLEAVFRAAHSLKGAARAVNAATVETLCQAIESVFAALQRGSVAPGAGLFDLLHRAVKAIAQALAAPEGRPALPPPLVAELRQGLQAALAGAVPAAPMQPAQAQPQAPQGPQVPPLADSVRVRGSTLDSVLRRAEEVLFAKGAAAQRAEALRTLHQRQAGWRRRWARVRADLRTLESALAPQREGRRPADAAWARVCAFFDEGHDAAATMESELWRQARLAEQDQRLVGSMVDRLLDEAKQIVVQPFSVLLDLFPPSVREIARDRGKAIELSISGADIAIDRRILDAIKDPLIHLVRNSIDHGIEAPAARRAVGKPEHGQLAIAVAHLNGSQVELTLRDDGAGFDSQALQAAATKAGRLSQGEAATPSRQALLALAFEPGVSTSPMITELSGRGLGLAIVKERVEQLAGTLSLESEPGQGTLFRIVLPLTLAGLRGVVVRVARQLFVLPTRGIERVARVALEDVKTAGNRETVSLAGRTHALARMAQVLGLAEAGPPAARLPLVVLAGSQPAQAIAFAVDEVLDERELLFKPLGRQLERVAHVAGAALFGAGQVVPVLHVPDLLRSAVRQAAAPQPARAEGHDAAAPAARKVLVAEDSITSRTLLKGILEGAGYQVQTAADGVEALAALRRGGFDLVVSDVDMPRLNGFGLTARLRADRQLAGLPVVLVTALDSREDREHGIDVGASAYIVKSSFDQGHLLEVVERLL